jgi:hypothetical protein
MTRLTVAFASILVVFACLPAHATPPGITYVVTRFDDPAPDGCRPHDCSLREAVTDAGLHPTHDIAQLAAGTYVLRSTLVVHNSVSLVRVGAANTRITTTAALYPALQIDESLPMWFQLHDLSLNASGGYELRGLANSCVTLDGVDLPNASSKIWIEDAYGCSTWIADSHVAGSVTISGSIEAGITDSTFGKLTVLQTHPGNPTPYATTVERVTVDGAAYTGSGMRIGSIGDVTLTDVTVQNTRDGLRIAEDTPSLTIDRLHYTANREPVEITDSALAFIRDSDFSQNVAVDGAGHPGALWVRGEDAIVQMVGSTFDSNRGTSDAGGAALVENGGALVFNQSTFAGNTFSSGIAASEPRGDAVGYHGSSAQTILRLIGVTLVPPITIPVGVRGTAIGGYGTASQAQVRVYNSIVQGSCATDVDLDHVEGSISTGGTAAISRPSAITPARRRRSSHSARSATTAVRRARSFRRPAVSPSTQERITDASW